MQSSRALCAHHLVRRVHHLEAAVALRKVTVNRNAVVAAILKTRSGLQRTRVRHFVTLFTTKRTLKVSLVSRCYQHAQHNLIVYFGLWVLICLLSVSWVVWLLSHELLRAEYRDATPGSRVRALADRMVGARGAQHSHWSDWTGLEGERDAH